MYGVTAAGNSVGVHIPIRNITDWETEGKIWVLLKKGQWQLTTDKVTNCQIEVDIEKESGAIVLPRKGKHSAIAPLRIMSFDVEAMNDHGFPEPDWAQAITIAAVVKVQGEEGLFARNVYQLGSCAPITGCRVLSYGSEEIMLADWC